MPVYDPLNPTFPRIDYTFDIKSVSYDRAQIQIVYKPVDTSYSFITYEIPILPNFDLNDLASYVDTWAPFDKWFAQKIILEHGNTIIANNYSGLSANT